MRIVPVANGTPVYQVCNSLSKSRTTYAAFGTAGSDANHTDFMDRVITLSPYGYIQGTYDGDNPTLIGMGGMDEMPSVKLWGGVTYSKADLLKKEVAA